MSASERSECLDWAPAQVWQDAAKTRPSRRPSKMNIQRSVFYRYQYVTGPSCVLVSIRFGKTPPGGPFVVRLLAMDRTEAVIHVAEVLAGVARANLETGGALEVEAIEVVPDDYPKRAQAEYVAYKIALAVQHGEA
jgi:hypothetical protein